MASTQVRLHPVTKSFLDLQISKINKGRAKAKKKPLTMDDVVALALDSLKIQDGIDK